MEDQSKAWDELYGGQGRQWRGVTDMEFPFVPSGNVLDMGCGNGKTSAALLDAGYEVTGIDFSMNAVNQCCESYPGMRCICGNVTELPFGDGEFDGIAMVHVMEHLSDDEIRDMVNETHRVLKDDGKLIVVSFSRDDMRSGKGLMIKEDGFEIRGNGIRYRYFDESDLKKIFSSFRCISVTKDEQKTKFGETRSRVHGVFEKT